MSWVEAGDGHQPGDPVQAVAAIRRLAAAAEPPLRLQLGSGCVNLVEGTLASVAKEIPFSPAELGSRFPLGPGPVTDAAR
jgi:hypothetical protein